ncbi:Rap1a/Tai family immunity protein [Commensalibacter oyaizuii]|uniref:Rap1a/Tai family immunity protein n=1 Tax=Commensalibacter oyaizuii TaxID=3043873 RepID=A0ABT6Q198_9PROT|nr:Rap1a/Tai family immunity protein [Commensalibacter sp. TBRC 16381]MDI2090254.1 Rap1a/Tai family immunity protein [Commensalibacter sp. TBRC 16381]
MNKKIICMLSGFAVAAFSLSQHASAQRITPLPASNFLQLCKNPKSLKTCDAYISGIADSVAYSKMFAKNQGDANAPAGFCIAPSVKGAEMREKVVTWMSNNPAKLSQNAGGAVFTALHDAYPCQPSAKGEKK